MGALYLLLPISLILVVLIGAAFWWAIFSGQFEDTDKAARSILEDNDTPEPKVQEREEEKESRRDNGE
ncbi:MAG TPA: cbb3-type cytochrome oxidase assembly protein CcoS [Pusillimonas sp.]|jgi:cbb3-type cytochrome oxidase maturation protein|nr:cbb3-type cytochrome oxidase assembly protein CcoS [Pusillimonas sp.]HBT31959.1 cbb3-type cytochrome oxidase assembly protein CcoS [Pusillimonas sp.]HCN70310.1 cbb3-type cytochrome oxidase assembly protein CcoS [Pusillimonas sp.]HCP76646.1 cbb3-type cytochrome oxidase assembly protein CcoS [Pusillimonas sp.]|tara:strand:+ start:140090 stop:140293 length:204 start_codon:yes stop_codon:yes gene_type:complete